MLTQLKQFVPSKVCLACDGCCRFMLADSDWRPKADGRQPAEGTDAQGFIKTASDAKPCRCIYLNRQDNTCGIYLQRPFECALYPFVISRHKGALRMYVHLACPYIQEKEVSEELDAYIAYLKDFFAKDSTKEQLRKNISILHDYSAYEQELRSLFDIEVDAHA